MKVEHCELQREQRRGRAAGSASLLALAARGCPAMLGLVAAPHNSLRSLRSLRSDRCDESEHEAREYARGHEPCASRRRKGGLPAARPRLWRYRVVPAVGMPPWWTARQAVPGGGDLWGGEREGRGSKPACAGLDGPSARCILQRARRPGVGARSALRQPTRRICPSAVSAANAASYATRLQAEHRSAVGAKRRSLHNETLPGATCRDALTSRTKQTTRCVRRNSYDARWSH